MKKRRSKGKIIAIIAALAAVAAVLFFVLHKKEEPEQTGAADQYNIEEIRRRTIVSSVSGSGTVVAGATESVKVDVTGVKVNVLNIAEGDTVAAGDIIAYLDTSDLEERKKDLQENYNDALKNRSEQNQSYDKRISESATNRTERIEETQKQIEEADKDLETSQEELDQAQAELDSLQAQVDEKQAQIEAWQALEDEKAALQAVENEIQALETEKEGLLHPGSGDDSGSSQGWSGQSGSSQTPWGGSGSGSSIGTGGDGTDTDPSDATDDGTGTDGSEGTDGDSADSGDGGAADDGSADSGDGGAEDGSADSDADTLSPEDEARIAEIDARLAELAPEKERLQASVAELEKSAPEESRFQLETALSSLQSNLIQQKGIVSQKDTALRTARSRRESLTTQMQNYSEQNEDSLVDAKRDYNDTMSDQLTSISDQIKDVQDQIDRCTVRARISGVVTSIPVAVGDRYNGGTIAVIENTDQFFIEAQIDEYDIPDIEEGMEARVKTDATRDEILNGQVTFVAPSAATGNSSDFSDLGSLAGIDMSEYTGSSSSSNATFLVRIALDEQNERLRLGMTSSVSIIVESAEDVLTVPYDAVYERSDGTYYIEIVDQNAPVDENGNRIFSKKEIDVEKGLEGTYYTEVSSDKIEEGTEVVVPKAGGTDTLNELMNMMGSDGGI